MPAMSDDGLLESVDQSASVRIIADDLLAGISPRHHMIDRAFRSAVFVAFRKVRGQETNCQAKNQKQRLTPRSRLTIAHGDDRQTTVPGIPGAAHALYEIDTRTGKMSEDGTYTERGSNERQVASEFRRTRHQDLAGI